MPVNPLLGSLRTAIYPVTNLERAKTFYTGALGREPYFDQPFYVGYHVDGLELGLDPAAPRAADGGGVVAYWRVEDLAATIAHLTLLGATAIEEPHDVGDGISVAIVGDPFGNRIGLIRQAAAADPNPPG